MKLDELLHRFQSDLQIRNYSARTVSDYGYNLGLFFHFLEQRQISDMQSVTPVSYTHLDVYKRQPCNGCSSRWWWSTRSSRSCRIPTSSCWSGATTPNTCISF